MKKYNSRIQNKYNTDEKRITAIVYCKDYKMLSLVQVLCIVYYIRILTIFKFEMEKLKFCFVELNKCFNSQPYFVR